MHYRYSYLQCAEVEAVIPSSSARTSAGGVAMPVKSALWAFSIFRRLHLSIFLLIIISTMLSCSYAFAEDAFSEKKFSLDFEKLAKELKSVRYSFYATQNLPVNQETFDQVSCNYSTDDPKNIASLILILSHNELQTNTKYYPKRKYIEQEYWRARHVVVLTLADSSAIYFHFGNYIGEGDIGGFITYPPEYEKFPIKAQSLLHHALYEWAKGLGEPMVVPTSIITKNFCNSALSRFVKYVQ
jgi:hypothetical protein